MAIFTVVNGQNIEKLIKQSVHTDGKAIRCRCVDVLPYLLLTFQIPILEIEMIIDTSHLLVGVNSAANFFLYYLLRKNFRSATWRLLTCKKVPPPPGPGMNRQTGNNNYSTTSFINRNTELTRVQRRATVAITRFKIKTTYSVTR